MKRALTLVSSAGLRRTPVISNPKEREVKIPQGTFSRSAGSTTLSNILLDSSDSLSDIRLSVKRSRGVVGMLKRFLGLRSW